MSSELVRTDCPRGGEELPCTCYRGPSFAEMTRPELEAAAERWRIRAVEAEQLLERQLR